MAKNNKEIDPSYSQILINKTMRGTLLLGMGGAMFLTATMIFAELRAERPWQEIAILASVSCGGLLFIPVTEAWVYAPWQKAIQRLEKHEGN